MRYKSLTEIVYSNTPVIFVHIILFSTVLRELQVIRNIRVKETKSKLHFRRNMCRII
jgi:hypothetical protein